MVNVKELRIGNAVMFDWDGDVRTVFVAGIAPDGIIVKGFEYEDAFTSTTPIPLTAEVLEKLGFKAKNEEDYYLEISFHAGFTINIDDFSIGVGNYDEVGEYASMNKDVCRYLHQLQNLYFALTGTELEVNL